VYFPKTKQQGSESKPPVHNQLQSAASKLLGRSMQALRTVQGFCADFVHIKQQGSMATAADTLTLCVLVVPLPHQMALLTGQGQAPCLA
jgi:hypothetical protein